IQPKNMTYEQMLEGLRWLLHAIYEPTAFLSRMERFVELAPKTKKPKFREPSDIERKLYIRLANMGPGERRLVMRPWEIARDYPALRSEIMYALMIYCQIRYMLDAQDVWRPELVGVPTPPVFDAVMPLNAA